MPPGSDVGNLSVLGYDPAAVYSGRSPLEAVNIVDLGPDDVSYRCNLVTVTGGVMKDNTAGHIGNDEAHRCFAALSDALDGDGFEFHAGVTYRGLLVWRGGELVACTPPHDILDQPVAGHLPGEQAGEAAAPAARRLTELQRRADEVLAGVRPATNAWFWGEGRAPRMPRFEELYGLSAAVVGAVDLVRGIGRLAGLDVIDVPGATGDLDTDYGAKARAAAEALRRPRPRLGPRRGARRGGAHGQPLREDQGDRARRPRGPRPAARRAPSPRSSCCPTISRRCARARTPASPVPFVFARGRRRPARRRPRRPPPSASSRPSARTSSSTTARP